MDLADRACPVIQYGGEWTALAYCSSVLVSLSAYKHRHVQCCESLGVVDLSNSDVAAYYCSSDPMTADSLGHSSLFSGRFPSFFLTYSHFVRIVVVHSLKSKLSLVLA